MIRTLGIALAASAFLIAPVQAQTANVQGQAQVGFDLAQARSADDVIVQLREAGFTVNAVTRTFLGRVRIEASNETTVREVVVSRSTGEILSDRLSARAEASGNASGGASATGTAASNGNAGGNASGSAETGITASGGIAGGNVSGSASVGATASGGIGGGNGNAGGNSGADVGVSIGGGLR